MSKRTAGAALFFLTCTAGACAAGNLLLNPGFRCAPDGTDTPNESAQYWTAWGGATREGWGDHDNDGRLACIRNDTGSSESGGWFQDVVGFHNTRYHFGVYLCADPGYTSSAARVKIEFFNADRSAVVGAVTSSVSGLTATWSYREAEGVSPNDAVYIRPVVEVIGQGTNGVVKLDAARLVALPENRLRNPGFLYGWDGETNSEDAAQGWHTVGYAARRAWGSRDGDGRLATLNNWNDDCADGYWYQDVEAEAGARYQFAGWFCADADYSASSVGLKLEFYDIHRAWIAATGAAVSALSTDWTLCEIGAEAPAGAWWMRAVVAAVGQGVNGTLKFDHLRLVGSSPNRLLNPGFRYAPDGSMETDPAAQSWSSWGEAAREAGTSHDGDGFYAGLHRWTNEQPVSGWFQDVPALPRLRYTLEGWVKADADYSCDSVDMKLEFYDRNGNGLATETAEIENPPSEWTLYGVTAIAPGGTARLRAVLAASGQGTNGEVCIDELRLTSEQAAGLQRLEPEEGAYTGDSLNWSAGDAVGFNTLMSWDNAVHGEFIPFPYDYHWLDSQLTNIMEVGSLFFVTPCPGTLADVTTNSCEAFAEWCREWNEKGVPILVRFGHEMNGFWSANWGGMRPAQFRRAFRLLADSLHRIATNTATVFAPYCASGYPGDELDGISKAEYTNSFGTLEDWCLTDADGNGILQTCRNGGMDDPYDPFYPGDDYVDWVGLSSYHWGSYIEDCERFGWSGFRYNTYPDPRQFAREITGNLSWALWVPNFYRDYSEVRGKPLMIAETSAAYRPTNEIPPGEYANFTNDEAYIKSRWIEQIYNVGGDDDNALDVALHFPKMKAICWFDFRKEESAGCGDVDWRLCANAAVRDAFLDCAKVRKGRSRYWLCADDLHGLVYDWNSSLEGWVSGGTPFNAYVTTDNAYERRGCVRIDYDGSSSSAGKMVMADYWALPDARSWSDFDAVHLQARVPSGSASASFRLVMQSAETGWDELGLVPCAPDGAWHRLVFPYDWSKHDDSSWLNLYLQIEFPDTTPRTVYVDALRAVSDHDADGAVDAEDPDDDNDGMPDSYEVGHGLSLFDPADAGFDYDGDGASNYEESRMNTAPRDSNSVLRFRSFGAGEPAQAMMGWEGRSGITYQVQWNGSLTGEWVDVGSPVFSATNRMCFLTNDCGAADRHFYRLRVP